MSNNQSINMTQEEKIKNLIERNGSVSRNEALNMRITRLGAIVNKLNKNGYLLKGQFEETEHGKDYVYYKKQVRLVPAFDIKPIIQEQEKLKL